MSKKYIRIQNNIKTYGPGVLPKNIKQCSNLRNDPQNAKQYGFVEAEVIEPVFDPSTHKRGEYTEDLTSTPVKCTWGVVKLTEEEVKINNDRIVKSQIAKLEATIEPRWVRSAALGDEYAIAKLKEVEGLLDKQRARF
ncbi:MAG: hypothetical protein HQL69_03840 [Magnetococcales bacterium]|nr:hypothetical protein [Magnetococcales bacterium]